MSDLFLFHFSDLEVFNKFHQIPFSKMLTFYRKDSFALEGTYSCPPQDIPYPQKSIGKFKTFVL